ncbi:MAG: DUF3108 domain-containing protein [Bacteroidetes bacterium]|nr:DUF3108 domain-containing protein [Bacteroidota bacterium]
MKKIILLACIALIGFAFSKRNEVVVVDTAGKKVEFRKMEVNSFKKGEVLTYHLRYGFMDAGEAVLEIKDETKTFGSRKALHVVGTGNSKGTFDWFFKVRDRYESYIDEEALFPWLFVRRIKEGGYTDSQDYFFNHYKNKVDVGGGKTFDIPTNTQDMISAFYEARCMDFTNAKYGDIFEASTCFVDNEVYPLKIKYVGKETIKIGIGKFNCLKFRPVIQKGRVFKHEEDLTVWITDDKNHIPVRAEAEILVGSIKMDLVSYSGLANPIAKAN